MSFVTFSVLLAIVVAAIDITYIVFTILDHYLTN